MDKVIAKISWLTFCPTLYSHSSRRSRSWWWLMETAPNKINLLLRVVTVSCSASWPDLVIASSLVTWHDMPNFKHPLWMDDNCTDHDRGFPHKLSCIMVFRPMAHDPSFWYEILVPVLGRRTWVVWHGPYSCPPRLAGLILSVLLLTCVTVIWRFCWLCYISRFDVDGG